MTLFVDVILPVLIVIGIGALLERCFALSVATLTKLIIYVLTPAFLFVHLFDSTLSWSEVLGILGLALLPLLVLAPPYALALRRAGIPGKTLGAMLLGGLVYNAGNVGVPVTRFFYEAHGTPFEGMREPGDGLAVQSLIMMASSLTTWVFGYGVLTLARGDGLRGLLGFFRLPIVPAITLAFLLRETGIALPHPIDAPLRLLASATVPVMLLALGAQLMKSRSFRPKPGVLLPMLSVKVLILPLVTGVLAWLCGFWPWPGAQLVIAAAAPTAINTLNLNVELDADPDTAAAAVFWSTILAAVTMTATMAAVLQLAR